MFWDDGTRPVMDYYYYFQCLFIPFGGQTLRPRRMLEASTEGWLSYGGCLLLMFKFEDLPVTDFMII